MPTVNNLPPDLEQRLRDPRNHHPSCACPDCRKRPGVPQDGRSPEAVPEVRETEKAFQARVVALAKGFGWQCYHTWTSIRSEPGFPDLCCVRRPRVVFMELKRRGGKLSAAQKKWLAELRDCPGVEAHAFWPGDWERIEALLR